MSCGSNMSKYILFFFNLFFVLAGLALLGLGIGVQLRVCSVLSVLENVDLDLKTAPGATMILGAVIFFVAFLGCCGSIRENHCLLISYVVMMMLLLLLNVALVVVLFAGRSAVVDKVPKVLADAFAANNTIFHEFEDVLDCCGTTGASVYGNITLPSSCCGVENCTITNAYAGCNSVLQSSILNMSSAIASMVIIVAALELVAILFALCLANNVRNISRRNRY